MQTFLGVVQGVYGLLLSQITVVASEDGTSVTIPEFEPMMPPVFTLAA